MDNFGGAEPEERLASDALTTLQNIMLELGVVEARHKVHELAQAMVWLGIWYDSRAMNMTIPQAKMGGDHAGAWSVGEQNHGHQEGYAASGRLATIRSQRLPAGENFLEPDVAVPQGLSYQGDTRAVVRA